MIYSSRGKTRLCKGGDAGDLFMFLKVVASPVKVSTGAQTDVSSIDMEVGGFDEKHFNH